MGRLLIERTKAIAAILSMLNLKRVSNVERLGF